MIMMQCIDPCQWDPQHGRELCISLLSYYPLMWVLQSSFCRDMKPFTATPIRMINTCKQLVSSRVNRHVPSPQINIVIRELRCWWRYGVAYALEVTVM